MRTALNFHAHEIVFENTVVPELIVANTYVIHTISLFGLSMEGCNLSIGHLLNDQPLLAETGLYLATPAMKKKPVNC